MQYLTLGKIIKAFGIKGEAKIYSSTHFRKQRYKKNSKVFLFNENTNEKIKVTIKSHRIDGDFDMVSFNEIKDINELLPYINYLVQIEKDNSVLSKNSYYYCDLETANVYDENGDFLGKVKKIEEYASYQTLRIATDEKDLLIPFVKAFIKEVNIEEKKIIIYHWEGLKWKLLF